jgi:hypothetical protein
LKDENHPKMSNKLYLIELEFLLAHFYDYPKVSMKNPLDDKKSPTLKEDFI